MKKIFFLLCILLCILLLIIIIYNKIKEPLELLDLIPIQYDDYKNNLLNLKLPTKVDRINCNNNEYKYCYNGELTKKDIFGNNIELENSESYTYGKTFSDISYQKVYLIDFQNNANLKGSSKTRDINYDYENTICNKNDPWHLNLPLNTISNCSYNNGKEICNKKYINADVSLCYSDEYEASYQYDNYYYNLKDISKYPFEVKPMNPKEYNKGSFIEFNKNDKVKIKPKKNNIVYSVPLCSIDKPLFANNICHSITDKNNVIDNKCNINYPYIVDGSCVNYNSAINYINSSCTQEKPYKYNESCYESIDKVYNDTEYTFDYKENGLCYLIDSTNGISCEELYNISNPDISMLYNPITNNYIGQLKYGDYSYIDCCGSTLTKCIKDFPYEINHNNEIYPIFDISININSKIPEYPTPPNYKEPSISKYINPYNIDIDSNLYIQCKNNYSESPKLNMCPKELPICEGYEKDNQFGFCNQTIKNTNVKNTNVLDSYNIHMLSCKNNYSDTIAKDDMCPYNLPYCEDNICKESSLFYNR